MLGSNNGAGQGLQLWHLILSGNRNGAMLVADTDDNERSAAQALLEAMIREHARAGDVATPNKAVHIAVGTV